MSTLTIEQQAAKDEAALTKLLSETAPAPAPKVQRTKAQNGTKAKKADLTPVRAEKPLFARAKITPATVKAFKDTLAKSVQFREIITGGKADASGKIVDGAKPGWSGQATIVVAGVEYRVSAMIVQQPPKAPGAVKREPAKVAF